MKSTGMVRKVDDLGRLVIPSEIRREHLVESGTPMEIFIDGESIILKRYNPGCIFCGENRTLVRYREQLVCPECIKVLNGIK